MCFITNVYADKTEIRLELHLLERGLSLLRRIMRVKLHRKTIIQEKTRKCLYTYFALMRHSAVEVVRRTYSNQPKKTHTHTRTAFMYLGLL